MAQWRRLTCGLTFANTFHGVGLGQGAGAGAGLAHLLACQLNTNIFQLLLRLQASGRRRQQEAGSHKRDETAGPRPQGGPQIPAQHSAGSGDRVRRPVCYIHFHLNKRAGNPGR
jgi:hypothetical protein